MTTEPLQFPPFPVTKALRAWSVSLQFTTGPGIMDGGCIEIENDGAGYYVKLRGDGENGELELESDQLLALADWADKMVKVMDAYSEEGEEELE
jgi:hypothetical protein